MKYPSIVKWTCSLIVAGLAVSAIVAHGAEVASSGKEDSKPCSQLVRHIEVYRKDGRWAGWPANNGIWSWGDEILVGFTEAQHDDDARFHSRDHTTQRIKFARSLDGGETWSIEDAYEKGITGESTVHRLGSKAVEPQESPGGINFQHPDFALFFTHQHFHHGPSSFYYSYDRGRSWNGPFIFPDMDTHGMANRTEYFVEGEDSLLVFLSATRDSPTDRNAAVARTVDGGKTWQRISWIGEENSLMPAAVRLSASEIVCAIRVRHDETGDRRLLVYVSEDNAMSWEKSEIPGIGNPCNPPALIRLTDGRLFLCYGVRRSPAASMRGRFSSDGGRSWSEEVILRGNDGCNNDMG